MRKIGSCPILLRLFKVNVGGFSYYCTIFSHFCYINEKKGISDRRRRLYRLYIGAPFT